MMRRQLRCTYLTRWRSLTKLAMCCGAMLLCLTLLKSSLSLKSMSFPDEIGPQRRAMEEADKAKSEKFSGAIDKVSDEYRPSVATAKLHIEKTERKTGLNVYQQSLKSIYRHDPDMPGEMGRAVHVDKKTLSPEQRRRYDEGLRITGGYNLYVSDMISVHRSLPDVREKMCQRETYNESTLPETSVIVAVRNEAWSLLLRTVHSILERSPPNLLREVILVDDASEMPHLGEPLDRYMSQFSKVKIVRMKERVGLSGARLKGAQMATSSVLTFLDSHVECTKGWLTPLLDRIQKNRHAVVCPVIDVIDPNTFRFNYNQIIKTYVGGFSWRLEFKWIKMGDRVTKNRNKQTDPIESPTMAGGLFSIDRDYFYHIGGYDPGFGIWGGENMEISFKTWMCGGRLEVIPCSHVGHIFRKDFLYGSNKESGSILRNYFRVALVWLDEYKDYFFNRIGIKPSNYGDISDRIALRKRIGCKSFKWYHKNIYPELFIPGDALASGQIKNCGRYGKNCIDMDWHPELDLINAVVKPCNATLVSQTWYLTRIGEVRSENFCLTYFGEDLILKNCHGLQGNQEWEYNFKKQQLYHEDFDQCLERVEDEMKLALAECNDADDDEDCIQRWVFSGINKTYS